MPDWDGATRFEMAEGVSARTMAAQVLVLDRNSLDSFGLDEAGARIWQPLVAGRSADEIVQGIAAETGADRATVEADTRAFIDELLDAGLVRPR